MTVRYVRAYHGGARITPLLDLPGVRWTLTYDGSIDLPEDVKLPRVEEFRLPPSGVVEVHVYAATRGEVDRLLAEEHDRWTFGR